MGFSQRRAKLGKDFQPPHRLRESPADLAALVARRFAGCIEHQRFRVVQKPGETSGAVG